MVPVLLVLNGIIWYGVVKTHHSDKSKGPYPENPQFDHDLDRLWQASTRNNPIEFNIFKKASVVEACQEAGLTPDQELIQSYQEWLDNHYTKDTSLENYLWQEGIVNPQETIWCEGRPLEAGNAKDWEYFEEIKERAYLDNMYHGRNLDEDGLHYLYITWFMLKGCSYYGAQQLIAQGVKPWEFPDYAR